MSDEEERFAICYTGHGTTIEPVANGCRIFPCCGGTDCGYTAAEAKKQMEEELIDEAVRIQNLSVEEWLKEHVY